VQKQTKLSIKHLEQFFTLSITCACHSILCLVISPKYHPFLLYNMPTDLLVYINDTCHRYDHASKIKVSLPLQKLPAFPVVRTLGVVAHELTLAMYDFCAYRLGLRTGIILARKVRVPCGRRGTMMREEVS